MKKGLAIYVGVLTVALAVQYTVELYWSATLALKMRAVVPWIIDAVWYVALGAIAGVALRSWRMQSRIPLLALVAVLPHLMFEITHGSDPAYPYIGLLFILPDLLWVAIGAGLAVALTRRMQAEKTIS
jgi:hypothetical protein